MSASWLKSAMELTVRQKIMIKYMPRAKLLSMDRIGAINEALRPRVVISKMVTAVAWDFGARPESPKEIPTMAAESTRASTRPLKIPGVSICL